MHQVTDASIGEILDRHLISPIFQPYFHALAEHGRVSNDDFRLRLATCCNYRAAMAEIVELLAAPLVPTTRFESLEGP